MIPTQVTPGKEYVVTLPSMYARGILFGKMVLELGDSCSVRNERTGMQCDVDFKTKVCIGCSCCSEDLAKHIYGTRILL